MSVFYNKNEKILRKADKDINDYTQKIKVMSEALFAKSALVFVLEDIAQSMPEEIWIRSLNFDLGKNIILLIGNSDRNLDRIGEFQRRLKENEMIKDAKIETIGKSGNNRIAFSFTISLK